MAVVLGTNAGFVTEAPVTDPGGSSVGQDGSARAHKHTTPAGIGKITEIGWWHNDFDIGSYELGLYAHDSGNDLPGVLLYSTVATNSGDAPGWETQVVDWEVNPETTYWIALQIDAIGGDVQTDRSTTGGRTSIDVGILTLQNPWVNDGLTDYIMATYAVVEAVVVYADLVGTGGGTGGGSGILTVETYLALVGTGGGIGGGSAVLLISGFPTDQVIYKRLIAVGNNEVFYEDI